MKIPRRRPRAVYEVYDAEQALGAQDGVDPAEPLLAQEEGKIGAPPTVSRRPGRALAGASQTRSVLPRMLAGAAICLAAICAVAAIAVLALRTVDGAGRVESRSARLVRPRRDATVVARTAGAVDRAGVVERAAAAVASAASARREAASAARREVPQTAPREVPRAVRSEISQTARSEVPSTHAAGVAAAAPGAHLSLPATAEVQTGTTAPPAPPPASYAIPDSIPDPIPGPAPVCACAPAEAEFGFEQ